LAIESRGPKQGKFDNLAGVATVTSPATPTKVTVAAAGSGPVIYDVTHHDEGLQAIKTPKTPTEAPKIDVPMSPLSEAMMAVDPTLVNPAISLQVADNNDFTTSLTSGNQTFNISSLMSPTSSKSNNTVAKVASSKENTTPTRPTLQRELSKEDFDADTFFMDNEIDNLKQILSGQIKMDTNMISNLFDPNVPLYFSGKDPITGNPIEQTGNNLPAVPQKLSLEMEVPEEATNATSNNEPPTLFELADIEGSDEDLMMPPPSIGGSSKDQNNFSSLETPMILESALELDANPLVAQIKSAKMKSGKKKF